MQLISPAPLPETQHISANNLNNVHTKRIAPPLFGAYWELMFKMVEAAGIEAEQVT